MSKLILNKEYVYNSKNIMPIKNVSEKKNDDPNIELLERFRFSEYDDSKINLAMITWSDIDRTTFKNWGDYWVKVQLLENLKKLGINTGVNPKEADVVIYGFGSPYKTAPEKFGTMFYENALNICWHYSHPEKMTQEEAEAYDHIFCASKQFPIKAKRNGWDISNFDEEPLYACTDLKEPIAISDGVPHSDILFVGNARSFLPYGRQAIKMLSEIEFDFDIDVKIYGAKWIRPERRYMHHWYKGMYFPYDKLNELYYSAKINLIDGHEEMQDEGFVSAKVFDTIASGGFVLMGNNKGLKEIFGNSIATYENASDMKEMITYYLRNPQDREEKLAEAMQVAANYTYHSVANRIEQKIKELI